MLAAASRKAFFFLGIKGQTQLAGPPLSLRFLILWNSDIIPGSIATILGPCGTRKRTKIQSVKVWFNRKIARAWDTDWQTSVADQPRSNQLCETNKRPFAYIAGLSIIYILSAVLLMHSSCPQETVNGSAYTS